MSQKNKQVRAIFPRMKISMKEAEVTINSIAQILAIGSLISPLIIGFSLWKMSQIFVSKNEFMDLKRNIETKEEEARENMNEVNKNLIELLQRTAHLREK